MQAQAREAIAVLDRRRLLLDAHIELVTQLTVDPNLAEEDEDDAIIYCITCGHEISTRTCIKHMERCYNKVVYYSTAFKYEMNLP